MSGLIGFDAAQEQAVPVLEGVESFALTLLGISVVASLALLSNQISHRLRIPAPAIFLVGAAAASDLYPPLAALSLEAVEQVVTVALILILFDGGTGIGVRKLRSALSPILLLGVVGTLLTAAAVAVLAHALFGVAWPLALLLGTALAPTDPAVVFSVLGNREVRGRAGVIIEGESGANDPVGIALLLGLLGVGGGLDVGAIGDVLSTFALQMAVGAAVGIGGGWLLVRVMRRIPLPTESLYPLRTLAFSLAIYGVATVAGGSGFLAVFVAGILIGDASAPFKREIKQFHSSLAGVAEIVAFVVLGLTISLKDMATNGTWLVGLILAALLAFVVRPLVVGPLLLAVRLTFGERVFVVWSGLKGAVPILLGTYILTGGSTADRFAYDVIFVVVLFSVLVQGGLVPTVATRCGVQMDDITPQPWAVGLRVRDEPQIARRYRIDAGAPADGQSVRALHRAYDLWISVVVRDGNPLRVEADTVLRTGDEVLVLAEPDSETGAVFRAD
jgi:cell volume regulation protein A